jgi:(p)ppGpp synthase/HD superfamily hydrolase
LLGGLRTRLGGLQIAHARRVANAVRDNTRDDAMYVAALLHDVVEKDCITSAELLSETRDAESVRLVGLLTRDPGETYQDYLLRCSQDPRAVVIKRADLIDKFYAADSTVSALKAEKIRRKAEQRLARLNSLASG